MKCQTIEQFFVGMYFEKFVVLFAFYDAPKEKEIVRVEIITKQAKTIMKLEVKVVIIILS